MASEQYRNKRSDFIGQDYVDEDIDVCDKCGRDLVSKKEES